MSEHIKTCDENEDSELGGLSKDFWYFLRSVDKKLDQIMGLDDLSEAFTDMESAGHAMLALHLANMLKFQTLIQIDTICRKSFTKLGISTVANEWITSIWTALYEGYPLIQDLSEEKFKSEFHDMVRSTVPVDMEEWTKNLLPYTAKLQNRDFSNEIFKLDITMQVIFSNGRKFFTGESTGIYGIGMPTIQEGDKIALLFPPIFMAFILRPLGDRYQIVCPAIVPPSLRTRYIEEYFSSGFAPESITIV